MTRSALITALAATAAVAAAAPAAAATRCVGAAHRCHPTIQGALDAARDGDTIKLSPGTYAGGIVIDKSVRLRGAGAHSTTIRGGGPVVTVSGGRVVLAGVKITGGHTSRGLQGEDFRALGGGVLVPPGEDFGVGASLTVRDSVITGNRAVPVGTSDSPSGVACPDGFCPYAEGDGGGIASFGTLKLVDTVVSDNVAGGPVASDAKGGGIYSAIGTLSVDGSRVVRNRTVVDAPNGRFSEGGGLLVENDAAGAAISDTSISHNRVDLTSDLPAFAQGELLDIQSHAGGALIANAVPTSIERSALVGNVVTGNAPNASAVVYDAALHVLDSPLTMRDTWVMGNRVEAQTSSTDETGPQGSAVELQGGGTLTRVRIEGNSVVARTREGVAQATGGLAVYDFAGSPDRLRVGDSRIVGNTVTASSRDGAAAVTGAGVFNNALLDMERTLVSRNAGTASGPGGVAQGGGIWNGVFLSGPPVELSLTDSLVTGNALYGAERRGGGLYTTEPVARRRTPIFGNAPDQVFAPAAVIAARRTGYGAQRGAR
jgi:hypothetical protein